MKTETYNLENEPKMVVDMFMDFLGYGFYEGIIDAITMRLDNNMMITITWNTHDRSGSREMA
jgi:hypothetical protein